MSLSLLHYVGRHGANVVRQQSIISTTTSLMHRCCYHSLTPPSPASLFMMSPTLAMRFKHKGKSVRGSKKSRTLDDDDDDDDDDDGGISGVHRLKKDTENTSLKGKGKKNKVMSGLKSSLGGVEGIDGIVDDAIEDMMKALKTVEHDLDGATNVGHATPAMLDSIVIRIDNDNYHVKDLAVTTVKDARTLMVNVFDHNHIPLIERAIRECGQGLAPTVNDKGVMVPLPRMTGDRREEVIKQMKDIGTKGKYTIRQNRERLMKSIKSVGLSKDETYSAEKRAQNGVEKVNKAIDTLVENKKKAFTGRHK